MKQPYVAVLIVFATVTPLLVGLVDTASRRRYPVLFQPESNEGKAIPATDLDPSLFDLSVTDPAVATQRGLFWAMDTMRGHGAALKVLENPDLFAALFPGYSSARGDRALWETYFQREFNPSYFFETLPVLGEHLYGVTLSWTGCFDLYRTYGADVIVFGNSEVYRSVMMDRLGRRLRELHTMSQPRVLSCTSSGLTVKTIPLMVRELKRLSAAKPLAILWGYSLWTAFAAGDSVALFDRYMLNDYDLYRTQGPSPKAAPPRIQAFSPGPMLAGAPPHQNFLRPSLKSYSPELTWDAVLTSTLAKVRELGAAERGRAVVRSRPHSSYGFWAFNDFHEPQSCDLALAVAQYRAALDAMSSLADRVFVFLTPTRFGVTTVVPDCLLRDVPPMLIAGQSSQVAVRTEGMEAYGLALSEVDQNHANFNGALKMTDQLAEWMAASLARR